MEETRGDHSIDIAKKSGDESSKPCIFQVPVMYRSHSPKSFTPNSFSIGPLHYKKEYLKAQIKAEKIKQQYLNNLLTRKPTPQTTREDFNRSILEVEEKARQCYDVPFDHISKVEFVDMLVLDGCFIIEVLRNFNNIILEDDDNLNNIFEDDPVFSVSGVIRVLWHDLVLLENQIPLFVLVRLFDMTTSTTISDSTESLTDLALALFGTLLSKGRLLRIEGTHIEGTHKSNHMLDLIRNALVSSSQTRQEVSAKKKKEKKPPIEEQIRNLKLLPTARLKESGIRFKQDKSSNLLDIRFSFRNGVLAIPYLVIDSITCEVLRNLVSYEQCYPNCETRITAYTFFLCNLITTPNDIELLNEADIVDNWLNPSDALEFFKYAHVDINLKKFHYNEICQQVKEYTNRWWPRTRAAYVRMFRDPIACLSLFAAAIALILTLLQTLYTVMQFYKDKMDSSPSPPPPF